jgi:hypothetical protein
VLCSSAPARLPYRNWPYSGGVQEAQETDLGRLAREMVPAAGRGGKYGPPGARPESFWALTVEEWQWAGPPAARSLGQELSKLQPVEDAQEKAGDRSVGVA